MKKKNVLVINLITACAVVMVSCDFHKGANLKNHQDTVSYAFGVSYGTNIAHGLKNLPGESVNVDNLIAGFVNALKSDSSLFLFDNEEDMRQYLDNYFNNAAINAEKNQYRENETIGKEFLKENKKNKGVVETKSGMQYQVITEGKGEKPTATDKVKVHFTGSLLDGTVFDSTKKDGEPFTIDLTKVFRGWVEALPLMPVGSKYIFWFPFDLGYGDKLTGVIEPYSTIKFEVELIEIVK
ncbi:peptidyl-prolyl cis-trans isomerase [Bacteroidia bacterium]|nr:peptidyl-prolyl cis-trans isomerase [Bacteroidia bacterium]GHU13215.1 peptidyl-prolyl cis-trans isomerase [Betaproteobacteria bacterium]